MILNRIQNFIKSIRQVILNDLVLDLNKVRAGSENRC